MCGAERRCLIAIPTTLLLACGVAQGATAIAVTDSGAPGERAAARNPGTILTNQKNVYLIRLWVAARTDRRRDRAAMTPRSGGSRC